MEKNPVIWTEHTKSQLQEIYLYIAEESIVQADRIFEKLTASTAILSKHPHKHPHKYPPDKYKTDNKGNYRAYEIYHYRISYKITETAIYIVRIRSSYQNPQEY